MYEVLLPGAQWLHVRRPLDSEVGKDTTMHCTSCSITLVLSQTLRVVGIGLAPKWTAMAWAHLETLKTSRRSVALNLWIPHKAADSTYEASNGAVLYDRQLTRKPNALANKYLVHEVWCSHHCAVVCIKGMQAFL